jgi:hypothetical protein
LFTLHTLLNAEATMVVEKASDRVPGRAPGSSRSRFNDSGDLQYVSRKSDHSFRVFPSRGLYRRRGSVRRWTRWSHHRWARPGAGPRPLVVRLAPAPLFLIFGLREASVKIGGSAFVSSNSENISCVTFPKHKNSSKQGTGTVASY